MYLGLQKLVAVIHPDPEILRICSQEQDIDTDTAIRTLKRYPKLIPVAQKYPNIFSAFLPSGDRESNINPERADRTFCRDNPKYTLSSEWREKLQIISQRIPKGKMLSEKQLKEIIFDPTTVKNTPKPVINRFLQNLPVLKYSSKQLDSNTLQKKHFWIYPILKQYNRVQKEILQLQPDHIPSCIQEWQFLYDYFRGTDYAKSFVNNNYRWGNNRNNEYFLRSEQWKAFISKIRSMSQNRKQNNADALTAKENSNLKEEAKKIMNINTETEHFVYRMNEVFNSILRERNKMKNPAGRNRTQKQEAILKKEADAWATEIRENLSLIVRNGTKKQKTLASRWTINSPFLGMVEEEALSVFRQNHKVLDYCHWPRILDKPIEISLGTNRNYVVMEMNTPESLVYLGKKMSHCIAGYSGACLQAGTDQIHILQINTIKGRGVATATVQRNKRKGSIKGTKIATRMGKRVIQGPGNRTSSQDAVRILEKAIEIMEEKIRSKSFNLKEEQRKRAEAHNTYYESRKNPVFSNMKWWGYCRQWQILAKINQGLPEIPKSWFPKDFLPLGDLPDNIEDITKNNEDLNLLEQYNV